MKCPLCNIPGLVKESRPTPEGTMRRYRCADGHKWKTLEQLELVYDARYVKALRVETGHKLAAPRIAAKQARLARGELTKLEKDIVRRTLAKEFQANSKGGTSERTD